MAAPDDPASATLAGIRAIEQAATAGPWEVHRSSAIGIRLASDESDWPLAEGFRRDADAEFAAMARTAIPRLLAALDIAQAALSRHQQWFTDSSGIKTCGGCLEPVPCKDTDVIGRALAGKEAGDGTH